MARLLPRAAPGHFTVKITNLIQVALLIPASRESSNSMSDPKLVTMKARLFSIVLVSTAIAALGLGPIGARVGAAAAPSSAADAEERKVAE
jgi:hypothetical protein